MVGRLLQLLLMFVVYLCGATAAAQAVGVAVLYARGAFAREKWPQYAAVLYGVELPAQPPADGSAGPVEDLAESLPRAARLAAAAQGSPSLRNRAKAVAHDKTVIDERQRDLQTRTKDSEFVRDWIESLLAKLETEANDAAVAEVQQTLDVLPAAQAKDLLLNTLADPALPPEESLNEVANLLRAMGPDRVKKILAEFKTEAERASLHRVLTHIGNLAPLAAKGQET